MKNNNKRPSAFLRYKLFQKSRSRAFSLIEAMVAMALLLVAAGMVAFGSASLERSLAIYDAYSAMADELNRQAEFARTMPIATLTNSTPIATAEGDSGWVVSPAPAQPLNGFLPDPAAGPKFATVQWRRLRSNYSTYQTTYQDTVLINISYNPVGLTLTNSTTVLRLFDANQQQ